MARRKTVTRLYPGGPVYRPVRQAPAPRPRWWTDDRYLEAAVSAKLRRRMLP